MNSTIIEDIGIYTNIHESGRKNNQGNKMFYATCKVCGTVVEKKLANIKRSNHKCCHQQNKHDELKKINDMPVGWINLSETNQKIYDTWRGMLRRATQRCWNSNPTYTGTTVDKSWYTLSNFVADIQELPGYDKWINAPKKTMMLDKDTLIEGNKHYSKTTCCFITYKESSLDVNKRHPNNTEKAHLVSMRKASIPVKATNQNTNEERIFASIQEACRELNLNFRNVHKVLSDKYPQVNSTKGWLIEKINQETNLES